MVRLKNVSVCGKLTMFRVVFGSTAAADRYKATQCCQLKKNVKLN